MLFHVDEQRSKQKKNSDNHFLPTIHILIIMVLGRRGGGRRMSPFNLLLLLVVLVLMFLLWTRSSPTPTTTTTTTSDSPNAAGTSSSLKRLIPKQDPPSKEPPAADFSAFFSVGGPIRCPSNTFTPAEVALHNTAEDLWIAINGNVLNVTKFLPNHPGGNALLEAARQGGEDHAELFCQFHSPSTVMTFSNFCIGKLLKQ